MQKKLDHAFDNVKLKKSCFVVIRVYFDNAKDRTSHLQGTKSVKN